MPQPNYSTLRVPRPYHESWAAMTPTALGRHCAACQKTVIDFAQKTDAEILAYLAQAGRSSTCGRFRREQLGRPLRPVLPGPPATRWQAWLTGLLLATLALQNCQPTGREPQPVARLLDEQLASAGDSCTVVMATDSVTAIGADSAAEVVYESVLGDVEELPAQH